MLSLLKITSRNTIKKISPIFKTKTIQLLINTRSFYNRGRIGNREVVGFGYNGRYMYYDCVSFPFPAIRFQEPTPEICVCIIHFN